MTAQAVTNAAPSSRVSRRDFLAAAGAVALITARRAAADPARKPNFVFILSDDQNWNGLSVHLHDEIPGSKSETPVANPSLDPSKIPATRRGHKGRSTSGGRSRSMGRSRR